MDKDKVAEILVEIGVLLELKGENPFKTRAYVNGARTIEGLNEPLATLVAEKVRNYADIFRREEHSRFYRRWIQLFKNSLDLLAQHFW